MIFLYCCFLIFLIWTLVIYWLLIMNDEELASLSKSPHTLPSFRLPNISFTLLCLRHIVYYDYISFSVLLVFPGGNNSFGFFYLFYYLFVYISPVYLQIPFSSQCWYYYRICDPLFINLVIYSSTFFLGNIFPWVSILSSEFSLISRLTVTLEIPITTHLW